MKAVGVKFLVVDVMIADLGVIVRIEVEDALEVVAGL